ncbi:MAG: patatin-like phospholipase family protein [Paludibacteraceae bacterium]
MFLKLNLSHGVDSLSLKPIFPTNFISPIQMNYAFFELFMQANAVADNDFNKLFIPFRSIASDIYKKEAVVFRKGDLSNAVRASMTFPFVFRPIEVDGRLLFDGGIFNNFPVDIMKKDFNPEFMIGSVVASAHDRPSVDDVYGQLQTMIMNETNYSIPQDEGILFTFDMHDQPLFDFSKVDELVEIGYKGTLQRIDEIKKRVSHRVSSQEMADKRKEFYAKFPDPVFRKITINGIDSLQKSYVSRVFSHKKDTFGLKKIKDAYYELVSDDKIAEIIPHSSYDKKTGYFDLRLDVRTKEHLKTSDRRQHFFQPVESSLCRVTISEFGKIRSNLSIRYAVWENI